jgi:hypothetical protein
MAYTTIDDPSAHFQTTLYTGNGSANNAITNGGNSDLQPDFVWIKNRDAGDAHCWFDSTRGATEVIHCNATTIQTDDDDTLDSFTSDGFQVDADVKVNTDAEKYVSWQWKANGGTRVTFTESGDNPGGGYQVNTTAGFSIVDYTGTGATGTVAHGLGAVPHVIILKCTSDAHDWQMGHDSIASDAWTDYLNPNTTGAAADYDGHWNDTAPTSTVFTLGNNTGLNGDGLTFIAYCFTPIQGYSKFGAYSGNGNANGPFVYTGFKPAFILAKGYAGTDDWIILDSKRSGYNAENEHLDMNNESVESDGSGNIDFLSNGFKMRSTFSSLNYATGEYVYMAFAENPFVTSEGIPCTAR